MTYYVKPGTIEPLKIKLTPQQIIEAVCAEFGVSEAWLKAKNRKSEATFVRMLAMFVLRQEGYTLQTIGELFDKDHTTVINAQKVIKGFLDVSDKRATLIRKTVEVIEKYREYHRTKTQPIATVKQ